MADYSNGTEAAYYGAVDPPTDVNAALWLRWSGENGHACSNYISYMHVLTAHGELKNSTDLSYCSPKDLQKSYIFLNKMNIDHAVGVGEERWSSGVAIYPLSADIFTHDSNRVYSNGGTVVYAGTMMP